MTIKWGDPIECNGVRPDWLRDDEPIVVEWRGGIRSVPNAWTARSIDAEERSHSWSAVGGVLLPADHPAYVALARGFHPWSGGESAPDDWDGGAVLLRDETEWGEGPVRTTWNVPAYSRRSVIGYRKRNIEPVVAQPRRRVRYVGNLSPSVQGLIGEITGNPNKRHGGVWEDGSTWVGYMDANLQPVDPSEPVRIVPFTRAEWDAVPDYTAWAQSVGLIRPETTAERFTRETGYEVTEAVEAALNWKGE